MPTQPISEKAALRHLALLFTPFGVAWLSVLLFSAGLYLASIPAYLDYLTNLSYNADIPLALTQLSLPTSFFVVWGMILNFVPPPFFYLTALLLFWRKPADRMVLFTSLTLAAFVMIFPSVQIAGSRQSNLLLPSSIGILVGFSVFTYLYYTFPNGRFVPAWTRYAGVIIGVVMVGTSLLVQQNLLAPQSINTVWGIEFTIWFSSMIYAQLYRYFRVSTPAERQQTKWVVFGVVSSTVSIIFFFTVNSLIAWLNVPLLGFLFSVIFGTIACLGTVLVPLSIAFSILRYRLWEADFIISRTLLYSSLTGVLTLAYFGVVIVFQELALLLTGITQTNFSVAAATLVIAALFQPFRRYLQMIIDRRFNVPDEAEERYQPPIIVLDPLPAAQLITATLPDPLSARELEVLRLIAEGLTNKEIAEKLVITEGTVKRHTTNIYGKLEVSNRTQAVARARAFNLLT